MLFMLWKKRQRETIAMQSVTYAQNPQVFEKPELEGSAGLMKGDKPELEAHAILNRRDNSSCDPAAPPQSQEQNSSLHAREIGPVPSEAVDDPSSKTLDTDQAEPEVRSDQRTNSIPGSREGGRILAKEETIPNREFSELEELQSREREAWGG